MALAPVACSSASHQIDDPHGSEVSALLLGHPAAKALPARGAASIVRTARGFEYRSQGAQGQERKGLVNLPETPRDPLALTREKGSLLLRLLNASEQSIGTVADGMVIYPDALGLGNHIFHRPLAGGGDEEVVYFDHAPEQHRVEYAADSLAGVARFSVVHGELRALDARNRSVFRMSRPLIVDADGATHAVRLSTNGCGEGETGRSRRGRGAPSCRFTLQWDSDVKYPAVLDPEWTWSPEMEHPRAWHTAATLEDGRVLVSGGYVGYSVFSDVSAAAAIYDPATGNWRATNPMGHPRAFHSMTVLPGGHVLAAGGINDTGTTLASTELFDPVSESWTEVGPMVNARYLHQTIEGPNYAPLAVSGRTSNVWGGANLDSAEVFDVYSGT